MNTALSLTPGLSPLAAAVGNDNRFNGFPRVGKPLKRLAHFMHGNTRLKPGANEIGSLSFTFDAP